MAPEEKANVLCFAARVERLESGIIHKHTFLILRVEQHVSMKTPNEGTPSKFKSEHAHLLE